MEHALYWQLYDATEADHPSPPELVSEALVSDDALDRWMGCKAAGVAPKERFLPKLIELATADVAPGEPDLASIAIWALARFPRSSIDPIWRSWAGDKNAAARRAAADLVGVAGIAEGVATLGTLLDDPNRDVLLWAALSLSKMPDVGFGLLREKLMTCTDSPAFLVIADALLKADFAAAREIISPETSTSTLPADCRDAVRSQISRLIESNRR